MKTVDSFILIFSLTSSDFGMTFGTNSFFLFHSPKASAEIDFLGILSIALLGWGRDYAVSES